MTEKSKAKVAAHPTNGNADDFYEKPPVATVRDKENCKTSDEFTRTLPVESQSYGQLQDI